MRRSSRRAWRSTTASSPLRPSEGETHATRTLSRSWIGPREQIGISRTLRTQLASTVDVTVLDQWLDRNERYDKALRGLYVALTKVRGRVTNVVRDAIAAEKEARRSLPPDSRALVVIISEIGRGGMNGAVIAIEEAKAQLADALAPESSSDPAVDPSTGPSAAP